MVLLYFNAWEHSILTALTSKCSCLSSYAESHYLLLKSAGLLHRLRASYSSTYSRFVRKTFFFILTAGFR